MCRYIRKRGHTNLPGTGVVSPNPRKFRQPNSSPAGFETGINQISHHAPDLSSCKPTIRGDKVIPP